MGNLRNGIIGTTLAAMVISGLSSGIANAAPAVDVESAVGEALGVADQRFPKPEADTGVSASIDTNSEAIAIASPQGATVTLAPQDPDSSVAVERADGGQVLTVLERGEQQARFDIALPEDTALVPLGKEFEIVVGGDVVVGKVYAPWAIDADGKALPTSYSLEGGTLVQNVDTRNAAFPVVADPRITLGHFIYVRYSRNEVKSIAPASQGAFVGTLAAATCSRLVHWFAIAACSGALAAYGVALKAGFDAAKAENKCMEIRFNHPVPTVAGWRRYSTDPACHTS